MPKEVGAVTVWLKEENGDWRRLALKNCTELLTPETINVSSNEDDKFGYNDRTLCLDPNNTYIGRFKDNVGSKDIRVTFYYETCEELAYEGLAGFTNITCYNDKQLLTFFTRFAIKVDFYEKKTKVDFSAQTDYMSE